MYCLIDCNNFYASCERAFRPSLNGKPVVVLSNNDGCVIARSNEAKKIGIPMGAPAFKFQPLFDKHDVAVFSANFPLYGDLSNRVMTLLSEYSSETEVYSIDECFLYFSGYDNFNLVDMGLDMRSKIYKFVQIPVSVGFATTKALSKVANRIAKKFSEETKGVYVIDTEEKRIKALKWLSVGDIWGIGRQHTKRLENMGVRNAYDFTLLDDKVIQSNFSIVELRLKHDLMGIPTIPLDDKKPKKSIATTRSFEKMYTSFEELKERVTTFSVTCSEKLRKQNSCCKTVTVFIHTNPFRSDLGQYSRNIVVKLPFFTNSAIEISKYAVQGLKKIFREGYQYKKAGVIISDFCPSNAVQQTFFENSNPKHQKVMEVMDYINDNIAKHKVKLADQDKNRVWKMRQEKLSPRYTTSWNELLEV